MNELVSQLLQLGPGIAAGARGNGGGMQAFMEAYQRTNAMLDQRQRQQQQDQFSIQDRQRNIERQNTQDQRATDVYNRGVEQQTQADALQRMQIPGQLAQMGGTAESPEDAKHLIETVLPGLMQAFGQETMAYGQPAVDMATKTITARQKRQVADFVEAATKSSFVADNPDSDPEVANLPPHIVKLLGKPSARLSELQKFAELPVGKPAGKPSDEVSLQAKEVLVNGKPTLANFNPKTGEYSVGGQPVQASPIPPAPKEPKPTGPAGLSAAQGNTALKLQDDYARDSKPYLTMREAFQRVKSAKPDAAGDLSLIFAYMKILDPNSVVREQEFANAQNAAGVPDQIRNVYNRVMQGTRLNPEQRRQFQEQAAALFETAKTNQRQVRGTYGTRAKQWEIPENMVIDAEDEFLGAAPPPAPKPSFQVGQIIRNRRTGEVGEVTGVRPDGTPIVRPKQ